MSVLYSFLVVSPTFCTVYFVVPAFPFIIAVLTFSFTQILLSLSLVAGTNFVFVSDSIKSNFPAINSFVFAIIFVFVVFPALSTTVISTLYSVLSFNPGTSIVLSISSFVFVISATIVSPCFTTYLISFTPLSMSSAFASTFILLVVTSVLGFTVGTVLSTNTYVVSVTVFVPSDVSIVISYVPVLVIIFVPSVYEVVSPLGSFTFTVVVPVSAGFISM